MIVTTEESDVLNALVTQMAAMVARETQRASDKVREDELRSTLRKADEKRWDTLDLRLDRVQASVENVSRELSTSMDTRLADARTLHTQSDEIVARMNEEAEKVAARLHAETEGVAARLHAETESVAASLGDVTVQTAAILKERADKQVVGRFLGKSTRGVLSVLAVGLFAALAFAFFEHRADIATDIATGLLAMGAVATIVYALRR